MSKHARVKDILDAYHEKGMTGVSNYLMDEEIIIDPFTWSGKMKTLLEKKHFESMEAEIASILFTFKLTPKDERKARQELFNKRHEDGGINSQ